MNARESLTALLETLAETRGRLPRQTLVDFVSGNRTAAITMRRLDGHELFGCGGERDDDHYYRVIDQALRDGLISRTRQGLAITPAGHSALRSDDQDAYYVEEAAEMEPSPAAIARAQRLTRAAPAPPTPQPQSRLSAGARLQIQLIQAMDREVPLDYFAEQSGLALDEVLDMLEEMAAKGRRIDIKYFVDEVLDGDSQAELNQGLDKAGGDLDALMSEWGDVYKPEEARLARIAWRAGGGGRRPRAGKR